MLKRISGFVIVFLLFSCETRKEECGPNSHHPGGADFCLCDDGFVDIGNGCECMFGYVLIDGNCVLENNEELFDTWDAHEECDQAGNFNYEIEIKETPDPDIIKINNLFEIDQDIECRLKEGGCDFFGDPKINGFDVVGEAVWDSDITMVQIDYTIKGTAEEKCSAVLSKS